MPFFIPHSDYTELSIKISTYTKGQGALGWVLKEEKAVTLKESAARRLFTALQQHLAVASENEDGSFLLLRLSAGDTDIGEHSPAMVANALTRVLAQEDIIEHLSGSELSDELVRSLRSAIRLKEMQSAVSVLREHLEQGVTQEQVYQEWCENHPWAFGSAYVVNDQVRNITASDNLDMLLPTVIAGYRDLVELKRPDMQVLRFDNTHRNFYWSADVSRAIGQCHRYLDVLHEVAATGLRDHPEVVAYHPRAIIVIGRSNDWDESQLRALHGLNHRLSSVTVMTYDQLLAQGERLLQIVSPAHQEMQMQEVPPDAWEADAEF
ncbi:Shedu immune nuclease family protein [Thioalkalicoccus limnaeus]|uniref:Shedu immune nuclease family protein n=1 Tax=Thioalkalicoccus limnaeus TaxID=120681 RepID=A0ABV4BL78_9GAMM